MRVRESPAEFRSVLKHFGEFGALGRLWESLRGFLFTISHIVQHFGEFGSALVRFGAFGTFQESFGAFRSVLKRFGTHWSVKG